MSKQKNNVNDLLAAIKRQPTAVTLEKVETEVIPPKATVKEESVRSRTSGKTATKEAAPKSRVGKPVQFWMHDQDRKLVRELSAWLAGRGFARPTAWSYEPHCEWLRPAAD